VENGTGSENKTTLPSFRHLAYGQATQQNQHRNGERQNQSGTDDQFEGT
jgi:hypothetical protein